MKAGRELDALVAEKVMGWTKITVQNSHGDITVIGDPNRADTDFELRPPGDPVYPPYSTDIAAAWEVVERVIELPQFDDRHCYFTVSQHRKECSEAQVEFRCFMIEGNGDILAGPFYVLGETAPHAICLAALRAVGVET